MMAMMEGDKSVQQMQATAARLMASTGPGLGSLRGPTKGGLGGAARDERDTAIVELQGQVDSERERNRSLEDQFKYRVASFVKRETQTKNKVETLEKRLTTGVDNDEHVQRMHVVKSMHKSVLDNIDAMQTSTAMMLQSQEKDLTSSFRNRLHQVSKDLEVQYNKKGGDQAELQDKHRKVLEELHEEQEKAQNFDRKNKKMEGENQKLKECLSTRADDRQELKKELALAKTENARLRAQVEARGLRAPGSPTHEQESRESNEPPRRAFSHRQVEQARMGDNRNTEFERAVLLRDATTKLRRALDSERSCVRDMKKQNARLMQEQTELQQLLRQCFEDVRAEILRQKLEQERERRDRSNPFPSGGGRPALESITVHDLTAQDRERVLELLLSQQRVVQLLYSKALPLKPTAEAVDTNKMVASKDDEFSWVGDIIPPD